MPGKKDKRSKKKEQQTKRRSSTKKTNKDHASTDPGLAGAGVDLLHRTLCSGFTGVNSPVGLRSYVWGSALPASALSIRPPDRLAGAAGCVAYRPRDSKRTACHAEVRLPWHGIPALLS